MRGIFLDIDTVDHDDLDLDELRSTLPEWTFQTTPAGGVRKLPTQADVLVTNKVILDAATINSVENLVLVCIAATGTNNVDLAAAAAKGITVCNVRSYATSSVVEHVFSLILCLTRSLPQYLHAVDHGRWQESKTFCMLDYPVRELTGQTLGIIGFGELGRAVAAMGHAFGMTVLVAERRDAQIRPGRTPFLDVMSQADVVSIHCPLTENTRNLIGRTELLHMKHDAILVNTARGGIVNESDLSDALLSGLIGGAAIDVLTGEPPRAGNPLLSRRHPNLVVTPHIAWAGRNSRQRLVNEVAANIRAFLSGTPRNVIRD